MTLFAGVMLAELMTIGCVGLVAGLLVRGMTRRPRTPNRQTGRAARPSGGVKLWAVTTTVRAGGLLLTRLIRNRLG